MLRATADVRRQRASVKRAICDIPTVAEKHQVVQWVPEDISIDWAKVVQIALAKSIANVPEDVKLAIDSDNMAAVLRVRARNAACDQSEGMFWILVMVLHVSRSPTAMLMNRVQQLKGVENKGGTRGRGYLRKMPPLVRDAMHTFGDLLEDGRLDDSGYWEPAIRELGKGDASLESIREEHIIDLIRACVVANATEIARRFHYLGICAEDGDVSTTHPVWLLVGLAPPPKAEPSRARAKFADAILAAGRQSDCDDFSAKVASWFAAELQHCKIDGSFPDDGRGVYEFVSWMDDNIVGDVQGIESDNSRLRVITKRSPAIRRDLQSSRHVLSLGEITIFPISLSQKTKLNFCRHICLSFRSMH